LRLLRRDGNRAQGFIQGFILGYFQSSLTGLVGFAMLTEIEEVDKAKKRKLQQSGGFKAVPCLGNLCLPQLEAFDSVESFRSLKKRASARRASCSVVWRENAG